VARSRASTPFPRKRPLTMASSGGGRPLRAKSSPSHRDSIWGPVSAPSSLLTGQRGRLSQHVAVQLRVLVFLGLVHMLVTVRNHVFHFMLPLLYPLASARPSSSAAVSRLLPMAGKGRQVRGDGRKGRTSVAEEAGCEEDGTCFCRLQSKGPSRGLDS
jgi:hypothetical protein